MNSQPENDRKTKLASILTSSFVSLASLIFDDFAVFVRFDLFFLSFRVLVYILLIVTNFLRNESFVYIFDGEKSMLIFGKNKICMQINAV